MRNILVVVLFVLFIAGCGEPRDVISISGSSTVLPIVAQAAEMYQVMHPDVEIHVSSGGSGVGISQAGQGLVDLGMSSRDLSTKELESFSLDIHTIGRDAVAVAVSSQVVTDGVNSLTLDEIRAIYAGEITSWADVGGPDRDILVIDKEPTRGTRHVFMQAVFGDDEAEAPGADLVLGSNNEEQTALTQSDAAIGMLSFAWLNDDVLGLALEVGGTTIAPTLETVQEGSYPITRDLFVVHQPNPDGATQDFLSYLLSDGQLVVENAGYVAIR